jgi:hypothetical protein
MTRSIIRTYKPLSTSRPKVSTINVRKHAPRALNHDMVTMSYFVGKGITLFTMFYTSLNWLMYKQHNDNNKEEDKN